MILSRIHVKLFNLIGCLPLDKFPYTPVGGAKFSYTPVGGAKFSYTLVGGAKFSYTPCGWSHILLYPCGRSQILLHPVCNFQQFPATPINAKPIIIL